MKVLHLMKTSVGGIWAFRQMRELVKLGVEVHVAMPLDGPLVKDYRLAGIFVHHLVYSIENIVSSCRGLKVIVKNVDPDIIHSHFVLTTILMRVALCSDSRPRIFQVPGPLHLENAFFTKIDLCTAQKNDVWVGSCKWSCNKYLSCGIPEERVFLSYYGGDIMHEKSTSQNKIHTELKFNEDIILVGMIAYMYAPKYYLGQTRGLKGHEDFIDAIKIVANTYPNVYGICIGGAWGKAKTYEKHVREYAAKRTDHVCFLGTRSDILDLYADLFCVVHPSHSENLGGAGESLTLGVPTIATSIGGFPDIVVHGKTGLLVPPKQPEYLAQAIIDCIESKYNLEEFSVQGKKLVTDMLDVKNTALSMWKIYDKIL